MRSIIVIFAAISALVSVAACSHQNAYAVNLLEVDGGEIAYREGGNRGGEAILFIHGGLVADSFYRLLSEPALADYRLITYHRPGYGDSAGFDGEITQELQVRVLLALLQHLEVERVHAVAHSLGTVVAVQLASAAPNLVESLTLLEGIGPPIEGDPSLNDWARTIYGDMISESWYEPRRRNLNATADQSGADDASADSPEGQADSFLQGMFRGSDWREELIPNIPGIQEQIVKDWQFFDSIDRGWVEPVDAEFYESVVQPILEVVSEHGCIPRFCFIQLWPQRTWGQLPNAYVRYVSGMGHEMMLQHPGRIAGLIAEWVSTHVSE